MISNVNSTTAMVTRMAAIALTMTLRVAHADVELNEQVRNNFGVATTAAMAVQTSRQWQASAQVLDGAALVSNLADLSAAQATASASSAELQRLEQLYKADTNAALKAVEAARAQAITDDGRVQSLQAQLLSAWGAGISRMKAGERKQLTQALLAGNVVLIRADISNAPTTLTAQSVRLKLIGDNTALNAKLLGALPQTNAQSLGKSYLLSAQQSKDMELQPGQIMSAELQDMSRTTSGIKLPRAAVLRWQGRQWAYVEIEAGHYRRVALTIAQWLDDAVLVSAGIKSGDKVVTTGAGLLLGAELQPTETAADAVKED